MISVTVLQESVMQIYEAATTAPLPEEVPGPPRKDKNKRIF